MSHDHDPLIPSDALVDDLRHTMPQADPAFQHRLERQALARLQSRLNGGQPHMNQSLTHITRTIPHATPARLPRALTLLAATLVVVVAGALLFQFAPTPSVSSDHSAGVIGLTQQDGTPPGVAPTLTAVGTYYPDPDDVPDTGWYFPLTTPEWNPARPGYDTIGNIPELRLVWIAARDIPDGAQIGPEDYFPAYWPAAMVPPDALIDVRSFVGAFATNPIARYQPITWADTTYITVEFEMSPNATMILVTPASPGE
ncbi:MAG: hypothetical protein GYB65_19820 [Chloroflexi bacterium]|nr:hypothetical protein [Chloroflexota bacterium]